MRNDIANNTPNHGGAAEDDIPANIDAAISALLGASGQPETPVPFLQGDLILPSAIASSLPSSTGEAEFAIFEIVQPENPSEGGPYGADASVDLDHVLTLDVNTPALDMFMGPIL